MKLNAFKKQIPEIRDLLQNNEVRSYVERTLTSVIDTLEIEQTEEIVRGVMALAQSYMHLKDYEAQAHELLKSGGVTKQRIGEKLSGRADLIYGQIQDYVSGNVLDLGCGDGKVGHRISQDGLEVILTDVYQHDHIQDTGLTFHEFRQGDKTSLADSQYDTVLLLTVMHHSDSPIKGNAIGTMEEAKRLVKHGGKIVVIESVYGIDLEQAENADDFAKLNREEAERLGLRTVTTKHLGIDQATVPEYHTLHVYEK